jgi:hypothetical protein
MCGARRFPGRRVGECAPTREATHGIILPSAARDEAWFCRSEDADTPSARASGEGAAARLSLRLLIEPSPSLQSTQLVLPSTDPGEAVGAAVDILGLRA